MIKNSKTLLAGSALAVGSFLMKSPLFAAFPIVLESEDMGQLTIGGAIRANYTAGDYVQTPTTSSTRGGTGAINLDTFRFNLNYENGPWIATGEYRFYPGYGANNNDSYHFFHTAWVGYNLDTNDQIQVGLNRTPFGPGPYGVSQSWMFDQHYYVGLSDNMNLGVKYTLNQVEEWTLDFAAYAMSAPAGGGNNFGSESSRYSYDVVNEGNGAGGYRERGQLNFRAVYSAELGEVASDIGGSLQYGYLGGRDGLSSGDMYALSIHAVNKWQNWNLTGQLTYYEYDVDYQLGTPFDTDIVVMGAYDFPTEVAAKAWIPAVSLSYFYDAKDIDWLDSITPYIEYSSIVKDRGGFNNSDMIVIGAAFATGGWYTYVDLAFSNGNDFVGNRDVSPASLGAGGFTGQFAENSDNTWMTRFNINFGYYF